MLTKLSPVEFIQQTPTGKTQPAFVLCEDPDGCEVEVVAKLASRSERGPTGLAMEVLAACLAADVGIAVPQPYLIELDPDWLEAVETVNRSWAAAARASGGLAFGSRRLQGGYSAWVPGTTLMGAAIGTAASILLFDAISKNADRRPENPNCLRRGDDLRIIDHELCFPEFLLGLGDAWTIGGLQALATPGWHIFCDALRGKDLEWRQAVAAWRGLSDAMIAEYEAILPPEWSAALPVIRRAIDRIKQARDNIDGCVAEVQRVLKC